LGATRFPNGAKMTHKICPNCGGKLALRECFGLLYQGYEVCKYCKKPFQINRKSMSINSAIFGSMIGLMAKAILNASIIECAIYALLFTVIFQRGIDFFEAVEPADENLR
jgi:hypothetical protein